MPRGIPVATVAIGSAENAALLAVEILALGDPDARARLERYRAEQTRVVLDDPTERRPASDGRREMGAGHAGS